LDLAHDQEANRSNTKGGIVWTHLTKKRTTPPKRRPKKNTVAFMTDFLVGAQIFAPAEGKIQRTRNPKNIDRPKLGAGVFHKKKKKFNGHKTKKRKRKKIVTTSIS